MEPGNDFIDRDLDPELAQVCQWMADAIDDCVNFGSHLIGWMADNPKGGFADATIAGIFRQFLELIDGTSVLIHKSCADAAKPLLRTALEAFLGLEYILEADTINRALAYQVTYVHRRIRFYRNMNPATQEGIELGKKLAKDTLVGILQQAKPDFLNKAEDNLQNMLNKPEYTSVEKQWQETQKKLKGTPTWFSLYGGPRNIEALATHLGKAMWYEVLYRSWSESVHATAGLSRVTKGASGATFFSLRYPGDLQQVTTLAVEMALAVMKDLVASYVPDKKVEFARWYVSDMGVRLKRLTGPRMINIVDDE